MTRFFLAKGTRQLVLRVRVSLACHDPDFDHAEGSSSDGFDSVVFQK